MAATRTKRSTRGSARKSRSGTGSPGRTAGRFFLLLTLIVVGVAGGYVLRQSGAVHRLLVSAHTATGFTAPHWLN
jgi:hypothetical protein